MATIDSFATAAPTPTQVRKVDIWFTIEEGTHEETGEPETRYSARYEFAQLDAGGRQVATRAGNLVPHLTPTQINQARAFLDAMLTKAKGTVE